MQLDENTCYHALVSRDSRFDGRFFTAVLTTGIYCRPVCPAVTPKRENVRFYPCAAAAAEAGFRPCRRCHPEAAPGTPAWVGTEATVSRALRYIDDGFLDEGSVDELALRLGMGDRHLRRLFREHLGSTPIAIAQTRRLHFARNLLANGDLSMTAVAMAAGFGSLRRFNTLFKQAFAAPPSFFRAKHSGPTTKSKAIDGTMAQLVHGLPYRPPYDWPALLAFLAPRAIPGVEKVSCEHGTYARTFAIDGRTGFIRVRNQPKQHRLELTMTMPKLDGAIATVARVRRLFDCAAVPDEIANHLARDPFLAPLVHRHPGLRLPGAFCPFELAVRAIIGQQVTVAGATTIAGRLVETFGRPIAGSPRAGAPTAGSPKARATPAAGLTHCFPTAAELASADLQALGMPKRRAAAITGLARAIEAGSFSLDAPRGVEEFVARFTKLPGIGPWTAQYVAMRAFAEPDAFPDQDAGLKAASKGIKELASHTEQWRPWRSYAAMHLWTSLADDVSST